MRALKWRYLESKVASELDNLSSHLMPASIPSELLYEIIALVCIDYIDECYARPMKPRTSEYNPITRLLHVDHRFRAITQKVVEDTLGVETGQDGM